MPAVLYTGYIGDDGTRAYPRAGRGRPAATSPSELFFERRYGEPLTAASAGGYAAALEAVRMAPSATNKQPWRIVRDGVDWHLLLRRTRGYGEGSPVFRLLRIADLQRVDLGIAMCSFALVAALPGWTGLGGRRTALALPARRRIHGDVARRVGGAPQTATTSRPDRDVAPATSLKPSSRSAAPPLRSK